MRCLFLSLSNPRNSVISEVPLQREINGYKPPLIRRSWPYRDFRNREFEMRVKSFDSSNPETRYSSSCMRSNCSRCLGSNGSDLFGSFVNSGVHDATTPKLLLLQSSNPDMGIRVGDQRSSRIWIQRSTGFRRFPQTLTAHHASPVMDDLDPFENSSFLP
jgi:hypothetical protein